MQKKIIFDITDCYETQYKAPSGITRVVSNVANLLITQKQHVSFIRYDSISMRFRLVEQKQTEKILKNITTSTSPKEKSKFVRETKRLFYKVRHLVRKSLNLSNSAFINIAEKIKNHDAYLCIHYPSQLTEIIHFTREENIEYIQKVHDLLPHRYPEFFDTGTTKSFLKTMRLICKYADKFLLHSHSTHKDLIDFADSINAPEPKNVITVPALPITIGDKKTHLHKQKSPYLNDLKPGEFLLFVSTFEPRKNHITIYHALKQMIDHENPPTIVFAGSIGWLTSDLLHILKSNPRIYPKFLKVFSGLDDASILWLYKNCKFTIYPSLCEGWGYPIQESLSLGKFCIASSTSSMPEVGNGFADYIEPLDINRWIKKIAYYWKNQDALRTKEQHILNNYREEPFDVWESLYKKPTN